MLPSRDMPASRFRQKIRMNRMCWLMVCRAPQAMCFPALRALLLSRRAAEPDRKRLSLKRPVAQPKATMVDLEDWVWFRCRGNRAARVREGKRTDH